MKIKKLLSVLVAFLVINIVMVFFVACGSNSIAIDSNNHNFNLPKTENNNATKANIFIGKTGNIGDLLNQTFREDAPYTLMDIVKDIHDASAKSTDEVIINVVGKDSVSPGSIEALQQSGVETSPSKILRAAFNESDFTQSTPSLTIAITEFESGLDDYAELYDIIRDNILKNQLSLVVITIADMNMEHPVFVFVVGDENVINGFTTKFANQEKVYQYLTRNSVGANMRELQSLFKTQDSVTGDKLLSLSAFSYQLIHKLYHPQSGITEIDFGNVKFSEKGEVPNYFIYFMNDQARSQDQIPTGNEIIELIYGTNEDIYGSYKWLRNDFGPQIYKTNINATVNFAPSDSKNVIAIIPPSNIEDDKGKKVSIREKDIQVLIAQPLLYSLPSDNNTISGKIRAEIPLNAILGANILMYEANVDPHIYINKKGKFVPDTEGVLEADFVNVNIREGNNQFPIVQLNEINKSFMINILAEDLSKIREIYKVDFEFTLSPRVIEGSDLALSSSIPAWTRNGNYGDVVRLFSLLDAYQADYAKFSSKVTIYVIPSNETIQEKAEEDWRKAKENNEAGANTP